MRAAAGDGGHAMGLRTRGWQAVPQGLRQAKPDGPTEGGHPELRAVLARGPSAPPLSPACFAAAQLRAKRIELAVSKTPIDPAKSAPHIAGC